MIKLSAQEVEQVARWLREGWDRMSPEEQADVARRVEALAIGTDPTRSRAPLSPVAPVYRAP